MPPSNELTLSASELAVSPAAAAAPERTSRKIRHLSQFFERTCDARPDSIAVICGTSQLTYLEIDRRANRLAHLLLKRGVRQGQHVGILLERSLETYVALLAVLKADATFVPLDPSLPDDRVAFIAGDAELRDLVTTSALHEKTRELPCPVLELDEAAIALAGQPTTRPEINADSSSLCYVIYTSGTTGRPKGVGISHASIINFLRVVTPIYDVRSDDRVYQGMTIAFDFSFEEIWPTWIAGATLVAGPTDSRRLSQGLTDFLIEHQVSMLCCVPTLLATIDQDVPSLRSLLVGGEACPADLVRRWSRPGRRMLNTYGPTETTVTATWCELVPDRPVTIGTPLPTYHVYILDDELRPVEEGGGGEICIGGPGVAVGYHNRPDLTRDRFVPNPIQSERTQVPRLYRTGDLGRFTTAGEIEYLGRIDTQVKIRGYRVELAEIESVLLQVPGIAQTVVGTYQPQPDVMELVAYYSPCRDAPAVDAGRVYGHLRERLPGYMVPAYLEQLAVVPVLASGKADRKRLPAPRGPRLLAAQDDYVAPAAGTERELAGQLAGMLGVERVSADSHFFDDLGADSLLMARFNAAVRQHTGLPTVSMKDIYLHPTVRRLAAAVAAAEPAPGPPPASTDRAVAAAGTPRYVLCGALQLLVFLGYACAGSLLLDAGATWATGGGWAPGIYARLVVFGGAALLAMGVLPIAAKWALIGRWKPQAVRVWSVAYLRFWIVKTLIVANPLARLCMGTPLYTLYLRALGAKIGPRVAVLTSHVPVCTDLLTIGAGSVIRKDAYLNGYRARSGVIETGAVTLGADVFVGEHTVLDIGTTLGDGAQLGHSSALHAGQAVPAGQCWHGSPAQPAGPGHNYQTVPPARCGTLRRAGASAVRLLLELAVAGPLAAAAASLLLAPPAQLAHLLAGQANVTSWASIRDALVIAAVLVFGLLLPGLLVVSTVPRLLSRALTPGKVYPLYGFHRTLQRIVARLTNIKSFFTLFGDSSAIVHYLRALGYRLAPVVQTGSNFGTAVKHEMPTLCTASTGTVVSDGLSFMNAEFSASSFRILPVTIGTRNFLGNDIAYPAGGRTGDNCLVATKALIPIAGPVREGVGLLGSPCFEIPRTVQRDHRFDHLATGPELKRRLAAKNRHNAATAGLYLLVRYLYVVGLLLVAFWTFGTGDWPGWAATLATIILGLAFTVGYFVPVERAVIGFRAMQPRYCSIYQAPFWRHERYWKVHSNGYIQIFNGTPFKNAVWRLLGVRIGRRVFDDGCSIVERTLTSVGSDCTLGAGSVVQSHSLEDGTFKSDHVTIGTGCTIGTGAYVLYGTTMGDGSVLDTDSFLMKGEHVPPHALWRGNPATEPPRPAPTCAPARAEVRSARAPIRAGRSHGRR